MMLKFLLLALVGICAAYEYDYKYEFYYDRPENKTGYEFGPWEPNREYVFNVTSKTMTALPDLEDQWTGFFTRAYLVLRPKTPDYVVAYIRQPEYAVFNEYFPQGYRTQLEDYDFKFGAFPMSSKPFAIAYHNGVIRGLYVEKTVPNYEVNIYKAWISQFQYDNYGAFEIKSRYNQFPENNTFTGSYTVMEPVVTGYCEANYDINVVPEYTAYGNYEFYPHPEYREDGQYFFEVMKNQNFDNCKQRMGYHFGFTGYSDFKPNYNQMGNVAYKSAFTRYYFTGTYYNYTFQSVSTTNKIVVAPSFFNEDKAMVFSQVNVTLEDILPYDKLPVGPAEDRQVFVDLVYSYNMASDKKNLVRPANETESFFGYGDSDSDSDSDSDDSDDDDDDDEDFRKTSPTDEYKYYLNAVEKRGNRPRRDLDAYKEKKYYEAYKMDQYRLSRDNDTSSDSSSSDDNSSDDSDDDDDDDKFYYGYPQFYSDKDGDFSYSVSSEESYYLPIPKDFSSAPQTPFLPYFTGYKGYNFLYAHNVDGPHVASKLVEEIAENLLNPSKLPEENTLSKFNILSSVFSAMDFQDLYDIAQKFFVSEKEIAEADKDDEKFQKRVDAWYIVRDAMADAGTQPVFYVFKKYIEERKLYGLEAASVFSTLEHTLRYPTEELLYEFFLLVTSDVVQRQEYANVTALMAYTNFVNHAHVSNRSAYNYYPVFTYGRLADSDYKIVAHKIVPYLAHKLREAVKEEDSIRVQVYVRALGNLGHPEILNVFAPYLEGKIRITDFQRLAMVIAFDKLVENYPRLAASVLFKIYQNSADIYQVRSAAVHLLFRTQPPVDMLQRMAEYTHYDPDMYVRSVVKSELEAAAAADDYDTEFSDDAKSVLKLLNPTDFSFQYSSSYIRDYAYENLEYAYRLHYSQFASDDHYFPYGFFYQLRNNFGGYKEYSSFYYLFSSMETFFDLFDKQFDFSTFYEDYSKSTDYYYNYYKKYPSGKNAYYDKYYEKYFSFHKPQSDYFSKYYKDQFQYSEKEPQFWTTSRIAKLLNIDPEEAEELEGQFLMKLFDGEFFYAFNNQTIESFPEKIKAFFDELKEGKKFSFTKFYQQQTATLAFPLASGFPFLYTLKTPTLFKFDTEATFKTYPDLFETPTGFPEVENDDFIHWPNVLNGSFDVNLLYHRMYDAKVGFVTPFDHKYYVAGYQQKMQGYFPLSFDISFDFEKYEYEFEVEPLEPKKDELIFHLSSWPYTGFKDITDLRPFAESPNVRIVHDEDDTTKTLDTYYGQDTTGFAFRFYAKYDDELFDYDQYQEFFENGDYFSAFYYPFVAQPYFYHQFNIYYDAQRSSASSMKFFAHFKQNSAGEDFEETEVKHPKGRHAYSGYYNEFNFAQPYVFSPASERRQEQFIKNAGAGIRNSYVDVADFGFYFEGENKKSEFVFTTAYADSPVDYTSRFLFFFYASPMYPENSFFKDYYYFGKQFQACFTATHEFPNVPKLSFINALNNDFSGTFNWELSYGEKCQGGAQISMKGKAKQSDNYRDFLRYSDDGKRCKEQMDQGYYLSPECQYAIYRAGFFDQYSFNFDYKDVGPVAKSFSYKFNDMLKYYFYQYYESNYFYEGKRDQFKFNFDFDPYAYYFNASFFGPKYSFEIEQYPFEDYFFSRFFTFMHTDYDFYERFFTYLYDGEYKSSCGVSADHFYTFDGNFYEYEMGECWHVIAHTVKPDYAYYAQESHFYNEDTEYRFKNGFDEDEQFTILARSGPSNELYFKIIFGQYKQSDYNIDIIPNGNELPFFYVNGVQQQIHDKYAVEEYSYDGFYQPLFRAYALPGNEIEISFRDDYFRIVYDGYRARFYADQYYYNDFVGLCGTNNGQLNDDFVSPDQCYMSEPEYFGASYALTGQNCTGPAKAFNIAYHQKAKESCYKYEYYYGNVYSDYDAARKRYRYYNHNVYDSFEDSFSESDSSSSSDSDSDSTSDDSSDEDRDYKPDEQKDTVKDCEVQHQYQFVEDDFKLCFTMRPLPVCATSCKATDKVEKYFDVHCYDKTDKQADQYKRLIYRGGNPDFSGKKPSKTVKFSFPKSCVYSGYY